MKNITPRINPKDFTKGELVGLQAEVVDSENPGLVGIKGRVVDETKSLIILATTTGEKKLIKAQCDFKFIKDGSELLVKGELLDKRPEDRIKSR